MKARVTNLLKFFWENFGPLLVFQAIYRFAGYTVGTIASIAAALLECFWLWRKKKRPTLLFVLSTSLCVLFGTLDLVLNSTVFAFFEAPIINVFIGMVFLVSIWDVPLVQKITEEKRDLSRLDAGDRKFFFTCFTLVWAGYYFIRASLFLWINLGSEIGDAFLIRLFIGKISLLVLIGLSTIGGRPLWILFHKMKWLPSLRREPTVVGVAE